MLNNNKIKLVYIIPSLKVAGAEKVVIDLSDNLDHEVFDVHIISLSDEIPLSRLLHNRQKIIIHTLNFSMNKFPWVNLITFRKLYQTINSIRPDIIHSHLWGINCLYLLIILLIKRKIKFYSTVHVDELHYTSPKLVYRIFKYIEVSILKLMKAEIIAISNPVQTLCRNVLKFKNVILIENGVNISKYKKVKGNITRKSIGALDSDLLIVSIGRYSKQKGQIYTLNAFKEIAHLDKNLKLLFIGRDVEVNLSSLAKTYGLSDRVIFLGVRLDVPEILSLCDIGVFPSLFEGMGLAFAEMMSCGLPVVASDIEVLKKISFNGEGALHVTTASATALANGLEVLIHDKRRRQIIAQRAQEIIRENYSLNIQVSKHADMYLS